MTTYMGNAIAISIISNIITNKTQKKYLIIQPNFGEEGVHLIEYSGTLFLGDTWHENAGSAMEYASEEYDADLKSWRTFKDATSCADVLNALIKEDRTDEASK